MIDNTRSTWKTCQRRVRLPAGEWGLLRKSSLPAFALLIWRMCSVNQCCGSGMFIPDPGSWFLPIPDPGSKNKNKNKREGWKKICCHNFLCSHKFHKIANYFSFEVLKKKFLANFQRIIEIFSQKLSICSQKYGVGIRDPGSEKKSIPDPGSRGQKGTGSRIRIRNTAVNLGNNAACVEKTCSLI